MRQISRVMILLILLALFFSVPSWSGTTGKIAGIVTNKATNEPLVGANVVVIGTSLGAATDLNGQFTILYVSPGTYDVQAYVIGYQKVTISNVEVIIDQTARIDFELEVEVIEGETVTIVAERPVVKQDVATSVVAVTASQIEDLPVSSIDNVVGLQAGIRGDLQIRGGSSDETLFLMDGVTLRDPRNNKPVSNLALSSIKEITIERGGFNAEYGQVRSGIVNVVTKEGNRQGYNGSIEFKYSPPAPKYFGISPFDQNSMWFRPYMDDAVCWTGTTVGETYDDLNANGIYDDGEPFQDYNGDGTRTYWNKYMQSQYTDFDGWNKISERLLSDDDPTNDLTPIGAQRKFLWEMRKKEVINQPDYNIDAGFGGPIPVISEKLGNLRFFTSYRQLREMLVVPLTRDDYMDYDWTLKLTSDVTKSIKLQFTGITGKKYTMARNWIEWDPGQNWYIRTPSEIVTVLGGEYRSGDLFGTGHYSLSDISHLSVSAKMTHMLSQKTFYEVSVENFTRDYYTRPTTHRDQTKKYEILPGYFVDEAPFNYISEGENGITGMFLGGHMSKTRDFTNTSSTTMKFDLSSQVNFSNLVKTGFEFVYSNLDLDYGTIQSLGAGKTYSDRIQMKQSPIRGAIYLQDKLEIKGFIMNLGARLDYTNSDASWWNVDPWDRSYFSSKYNPEGDYNKTKTKPQWQLSPRLGISHPITENSKLYFNYGHFKQIPAYETMFRVARNETKQVVLFGDPNLILARTISYELGYDQSVLGDFLIQLAAFYHDITDQQDITTYTSIGGIIYDKTTSNSYEDIRGFELTLRKSQGRWWTFFANYTYQASSSGHFGREEVYQDPLQQQQWDEATVNLYQERPIPRPYARANLSLFSPDNFGPKIIGIYPFGGYLMNILLDWQAGEWVTWNPAQDPKVKNNVQKTDWFNSTLRLSKTFSFNRLKVQLFMDIDNLLNYKQMALDNWGKDGDHDQYYQSLHLPKSDVYDNIVGDDRIGTYRKHGVAYQPMEKLGVLNEKVVIDPDVVYWVEMIKDPSTGKVTDLKKYMEYDAGSTLPYSMQEVESKHLKQILDDKAYIDMPNMTSFNFLDPRQFYFGVRLSFDL